jgi:hypothetical protein
MRWVFLLVVLILTASSISVAQTPDGVANLPAQLYELYSWRQSNGIWCFRVLPSPSGVNTPADVIFDKKFLLSGVDEMKRKISELPAGTKLLWMDHIAVRENTKAPGGPTIAYPPTRIIEQVKRYARKKRIEVEFSAPIP